MPASHDPVEIARALIECPSVTPEDAGALDVLEGLLGPAGFAVDRPVFSEEGTAPIENLFAVIGAGGRHLCFAGHTDVVPAGDLAAWTHPPFAATVSEGVLYGRGAVDMKGGIAAFAAAALGFVADRGTDFGGRISFLITGDEEGPAVNGTEKLIAWVADRGDRPTACLVGEPTNPTAIGDAIKVGRRGSLTGRLTIRGVQGHVAYPHLADNPILALPSFITALAAPLDDGTDHFQPSNLEITTVDVGNGATNVIPGSVRVTFNVRYNDRWTPDALKQEILGRLERAAAATPLRRAAGPAAYECRFDPSKSDVFLTHSPALIDTLVEAIESVTGRRPDLSTGGGTSDARFIKSYCPVVEFGLVGATMHMADERVAVDDLRLLTRIYRAFLDRFFAG